MLSLILALAQAPAHADTYVWFQPWKDAAQLAEVLGKVPEGRAVLERARKADPAFLGKVQAGKTSFTERVPVGELKPSEPDQFAIQQRVSLKKGLPLSDAAADLVHELVHFADRRLPDPRSKDFVPSKYVRAAIEGEGGELKAFETECRTAWALEKEFPAFPKHETCERYKGAAGFEREKARLDYYAVGNKRDKLPLELRTGLPELNEKAPVFLAGFDGKSYPVSLAEEYERTVRTLCSLGQWKRKKLEERAKAKHSTAQAEFPRQLEAIVDFERLRCR